MIINADGTITITEKISVQEIYNQMYQKNIKNIGNIGKKAEVPTTPLLSGYTSVQNLSDKILYLASLFDTLGAGYQIKTGEATSFPNTDPNKFWLDPKGEQITIAILLFY
ncbi:MAG: hypothetical protein LBG52_02225 [Candidatus Peribacteria bacterium]|nr:hypothetical protein [Candidatus Peribacteria bacterium]